MVVQWGPAVIIATRNPGSRGRSIVRVDKHPAHFGYSAIHNTPSLLWEATGYDGKTYRVYLDAADLRALDEARKRYPSVERGEPHHESGAP